MFGCPVPTNLPPSVAMIPLAALGSPGTQWAAWVLSGFVAGLALVGAWLLLSSVWPSKSASEYAQSMEALDHAA